MRNFKAFLALILAMMLLIGATVITTGAAEEGDYSDAAQRLAAINILKGDTNGNLMLDQGVTRWHTALFFVQALTGRTDGAEWNAVKESDIFTDVPEYGTAIDYAAGIGLIKGRGDGIYGYGDSIIYQDMLVMAVRALGYETAEMSYPYGHIMAAEKLGLNENVAKTVNYKDALTRGETAQIIWNMLSTEIAFVDPLTKKILYPGEFSITGQLGGIKRVTLLEEAGFAHDVIEGVITDFTEGKLSTDIDTVTVESEDGDYVLNAADLGITEKTRKDSYLNLPVFLYINCKIADFQKNYDAEELNEEAKVIFTELTEFTSVVNIGDETNIKFTAAEGTKAEAITLAGTKYAADKYTYDLRVLEEDGWVEADADLLENFLYDTKKGHIGGNSYGEIRYTVLIDEETDEQTLLMLYMPFAFGRYRTRTVRYEATGTSERFVTVGTYERERVITDFDGSTSTHFVERLLGNDFVSNGMILSDGVTSIGKRDGQASKEVTLTGAPVKTGEFMFYYYNELDNVLHVASVEGTAKTGTISSYSNNKETLKIDGVTYDYGFAGAHAVGNYPAFNQRYSANGTVVNNVLETAMGYLTAGEKNLTYVLAGGRVVYAEEKRTTNEAKQHSFVIASTDAARVAELLELSDSKYASATADTEGLYIDSKGNIAVAVLNTTSGKWELASVKSIEMEYDVNGNGTIANSGTTVEKYNANEDEFPVTVEIGVDLKNYSIFGDSYNYSDELIEAVARLKNDTIFMVRANSNKVYTLAPIVDACITFGNVSAGLGFSDQGAKTNFIKIGDADAARVTLTDKSVIVAINELGEVGVRTGIQMNANSLDAEHIAAEYGKDIYAFTSKTVTEFDARFYSAKAALIVVKFDGPVVFKEGQNGEEVPVTVDVEAWGSANENEAYYILTNDTVAEYERLDDGSYHITLSNLYNLTTMRHALVVEINVEDLDDIDFDADDIKAGTILHRTKEGVFTDKDGSGYLTLERVFETVADMRASDGDDYMVFDMSTVEFSDEYTFKATNLDEHLDGIRAVGEIDIRMVTLDLSSLDDEEYDYSRIVVDADDVPYDDADARDYGVSYYKDNDGVLYYDYNLDAVGKIVTLNEPVAGQLNQFVIDMAGKKLLVPEIGADDLEDAAEVTVEFAAIGMFDKDEGKVSIYLMKMLTDMQ